MISRDKKAGGSQLYKFMYLHLGNIVGNSTPQWICMIPTLPSNRRYQIRTYKLCLCLICLVYSIQYLIYQQDSRKNTLLLSYSMADPPATSPTSTTSEPLPIAIIGMYVVTHTPIIHTFISIGKFLLAASFLHIYKKKTQNKKKITKTIGAGIAGLALAIGLHNNNHHPFILYEEASEFSAVGYVHKLS